MFDRDLTAHSALLLLGMAPYAFAPSCAHMRDALAALPPFDTLDDDTAADLIAAADDAREWDSAQFALAEVA